jgi:XTP/dITP diphosphohydrolase
MRVSFVTTNPVKIASLKRVLNERGIEVDVIDRDIPEIQALTADEVAAAKAVEAFRLFGRPVLVNDFACHIDALNGWPGAFVKFETERLGIGTFFRMLKTPHGHLGYGCRLANAVAYMDADLPEPKVFARSIRGVLSPQAYEALPAKEGAWVDTVFVPDGEFLPLGEMSPAQKDAWRRRDAIEGYYRALADWLVAREAMTAAPPRTPTG